MLPKVCEASFDFEVKESQNSHFLKKGELVKARGSNFPHLNLIEFSKISNQMVPISESCNSFFFSQSSLGSQQT